MKLKEYLNELLELTKSNPQVLEFEVIYASDDEGNNYQKVYSTGSICQIDDLKERDLELVGFYDEDEPESSEDFIALEDCNAIVIN